MAKKKLESSVLKSFAEDSYRKISNEKLRISFKFVDWESEELFLHGLSKKYYELLFDAFNDIQNSLADDIKQQTHPRLMILMHRLIVILQKGNASEGEIGFAIAALASAIIGLLSCMVGRASK